MELHRARINGKSTVIERNMIKSMTKEWKVPENIRDILTNVPKTVVGLPIQVFF